MGYLSGLARCSRTRQSQKRGNVKWTQRMGQIVAQSFDHWSERERTAQRLCPSSRWPPAQADGRNGRVSQAPAEQALIRYFEDDDLIIASGPSGCFCPIIVRHRQIASMAGHVETRAHAEQRRMLHCSVRAVDSHSAILAIHCGCGMLRPKGSATSIA